MSGHNLFDPEPETEADLEGARMAAQGDHEDRSVDERRRALDACREAFERGWEAAEAYHKWYASPQVEVNRLRSAIEMFRRGYRELEGLTADTHAAIALDILTGHFLEQVGTL